MFQNKAFDRTRALELINEIADINQPILNLHGDSSTYLYEAQDYNNIEAVRILLENGANPNFNDPELIGDCALWDLSCPWVIAPGECDETENAVRYQIAKLFFSYGADPDIMDIDIMGDSVDTLFDFVSYDIYTESDAVYWEYTCNFYKLLLAYGGGGGKSAYPKMIFTEAFDKTKIDEYHIQLFSASTYTEIRMIDPEGKVVGST